MQYKTIFLFFFVLEGMSLFAQVRVKPNGNGNGDTWQNAANLQAALSIARAGDEVWLQAGTYYPVRCNPCTELNRQTSFVIPDGVKVFGGFSGNENNRTQRDWENNKTILSGDIDQNNSMFQNSYSVVRTNEVSNSTVMDGVTITNGNAQGDTVFKEGPFQSGGGWYNGAVGTPISNPQIINCIFENNIAEGFGGAMYNMGSFEGLSEPIYKNCIFRNNQSEFDGGAIYSNGSFGGNADFVLENCIFDINSAGLTIGSGGALFNNGIEGSCNPAISNCEFNFQTASLHGGAIYNQGKDGDASPFLDNCIFNKNRAEQGGAIYNLGVQPSGNSSPTFTNCTFFNNFAEEFGGAIIANGDLRGNSEPIFRNCIFWKNRGQDGGDIFNMVYGDVVLDFCLVDELSCNLMLSTMDNSSSITCLDGMLYNKPPKFQDEDTGNLRIKHNSAALDSGNPSLTTSNYDIDGNPRILLDNIDLGAVEYNGPRPSKLDTFVAITQNNFIELNWVFEREFEMAGCEIRRRRNNAAFETIAWIPSFGNTDSEQAYQAFDVPPLRGEVYDYHLLCFDKDSCDQISRLDTAFVRPDEIIAKANPSPAISQTNLKVFFPNDNGRNSLEIFLVGYSGKVVVQEQKTSPGEGWTSFNYDVTTFSSGLYFFYILANGEQITLPLVISKL